MAEPQYLPVARLAARYGRAEATIRMWRDRFKAFLPSKVLDETVKVGASGVQTTSQLVGYDVARFDEVFNLVTTWMPGPPKRTLEMVSWKLSEKYPIEGKAAGIPTRAEAMATAPDAADPTVAPQAPLVERGPRPEAQPSVTAAIAELRASIDTLARNQAAAEERFGLVLHALEHSMASGGRFEAVVEQLAAQTQEIVRTQAEQAGALLEAQVAANEIAAQQLAATRDIAADTGRYFDEERKRHDESRTWWDRLCAWLGMMGPGRREPIDGEPKVAALMEART